MRMPYDVILVSNYLNEVEKNPNSFNTKVVSYPWNFLNDYVIVCCLKRVKFSTFYEVYCIFPDILLRSGSFLSIKISKLVCKLLRNKESFDNYTLTLSTI